MMVTVLRISAAAKWSNCSASPRFEAAVPPQPESDEAREGTAAIWVAECVLLGDAATAEDMVGKTHKNGWLVTHEMTQHAQGFVDMLVARGGSVWPERHVKFNQFIEGRLDVASVVDQQGVLFVDDFKYGYNLIDPYENKQLIGYAWPLWRDHPNSEKINVIQLGIYQPRGFHPDGIYRTWTISVDVLKHHAAVLEDVGRRALDPNSVATPGPWCKSQYCDAAASCVSLAHTIYSQAQLVQSPVQKTMTGEELSQELTFLDRHEKLVKARKSAVFSEAEERIKRTSEFVPGWAMKPKTGAKRKLIVSPVTAEALTGVKATKVVERSPKEMEDDGAPIAVMKSISQAPNIGNKLTPVSKRDTDKAFKKD